jgi:hypothetical protein
MMPCGLLGGMNYSEEYTATIIRVVTLVHPGRGGGNIFLQNVDTLFRTILAPLRKGKEYFPETVVPKSYTAKCFLPSHVLLHNMRRYYYSEKIDLTGLQIFIAFEYEKAVFGMLSI